eukprot:COSAG06_NODE_10470_length_1677_cov_1.547529_2_plen_180_part_01
MMQMMGMMSGFQMGVEMLTQMGQMGEDMSNKIKGIEIDPNTGLPMEKELEVYEPPYLARLGRQLELEASKLCMQFRLLRYVLALLGIYPRSPKALKRLGKEERKRAKKESKQLKLITKGKAKREQDWQEEMQKQQQGAGRGGGMGGGMGRGGQGMNGMGRGGMGGGGMGGGGMGRGGGW